jgi:4-hydroxyphenylacetate 3-monooxygenase
MVQIKGARNIWLDGKKVEKPAEHDAFRGTFETIKQLIKLIDDGKVGFYDESVQQNVHKAFLIPQTREQLLEKREAYETWASKSYGMMSRLSDYAYTLITGYYIDREQLSVYDATFAEKISNYFELVKRERRLVTTAIADPQMDRSKPITEREAHALLRVVEKREDGVVVSGAKMIATGAPYVDDIIINTPYSKEDGQEQYANLFIVATDSPGLEIICRKSHAENDRELYPLASQFDEMDAVVIFDNVFIPNERIFIRGHAQGATAVHRHQQLNSLAHYQTVVRLAIKLKFVAGLATAIAKSIAVDTFLHVQQKLGELYMQVDTINGLLQAAETEGSVEGGVYKPSAVPLQVARHLGTQYYARAMSILKEIGAGGFTQLPSTAIHRFEDERVEVLLHRYYEGAATSAQDKTALFRVGWELVGSEIGSRHDLYERFYTGDPLRIHALFLENYDKRWLDDRLDTFLNSLTTTVRQDVFV